MEKQKTDKHIVKDMGVLYYESSAHLKHHRKKKAIHFSKAQKNKDRYGLVETPSSYKNRIGRGDYNPKRWEDFKYDQMKEKESKKAQETEQTIKQKLKEIDKTGPTAIDMMKDYAKKEKNFDYGPSEAQLKKNDKEMAEDLKEVAKRNRKAGIYSLPAKEEKVDLDPKVEYEKKMPDKFDIIIPDAKAFKNWLDANEDINDEPYIVVQKDGLEIIAMNPSAITMIHSKYPSKYMEKWDATPGIMDVNLSWLKNQIGKVEKDESIKLVKEGNDKLKITLYKPDGATREIQMPLSQNNELRTQQEPNGMELEDNKMAHFEIQAHQLKDMAQQAHKLGKDYIYFATKDGELKIYYKNKDNEEKTETSYPMSIEGKKDQEPTGFNAEYIRNMFKGAGKDTKVHISLAHNIPMKLEYVNYGQEYRYWIAPYIED